MRILHLEDDVSDAELVAHILKKGDLECDIKLVGTRARYTDALTAFRPDLIISDHNLPDFDSMEAMRVMQNSISKIPFVLVTGTVSEEFAVEAMRAGADDYILKDRLQRLPVAIRNVMEKFRLEREKKKSDTLLQNIDANSLDMICSVNEEGYFLHVSAACEAMLGYTPAELVGRNLFDFVYEEDKQKTIYSANHVRTGKLLTNFQNRYVRKDGSLATLSWSTRQDEHDRVRYGVARDVTEKNIADEKIRQAELLLRNIDANSLDVICTINREGIFTYVSSASAKVWGYSPDELVGKNFIHFVHEEDREKTSRVDRTITDGQSISLFENRYVRKDGSIVPMIWSSQWDENEKMIYCVAKDATEIKKLEYAHRSEQQRFIDLFLEAPAAIGILKGPSHVYQLFNPLYQQFTGRKDIIGKTVAEVFPELESQGLIRLLDKVYRTGKTISRTEVLLKMYVDDSGTLSDVYCDYVVQPYRNGQGEVDGVFFFSVDVTDRVLSKKRIEVSEKRYRQIVETAQEGIWVTDEHDITTFVNTKLCEILEYARDEMMGRTFSSFMDDEGRASAADFIQKKMSGQTCHGQLKYISKSGNEIWTKVSANPLLKEDGVYGGALAMVTDITQQKKIEEEHKKLSDVASLTVNAVIVTDVKGRITWVNQGFERLSEYTFDDVFGKKREEILAGPNTDENVSSQMARSAKSGHGFRVEILNYSKSGRQYWLDIEARPLHDSQNKLTGFMSIEQDITERKKFETKLVRRDNQLMLATEIAGLGYWEYDVLNDQFIFNDLFYKVFRTSAEAVGGYTMSAARYAEIFVHQDDAEIVNKSVREAISSTHADFSFKAEHRIIYPGGEIGYISVHFRTIKGEDGKSIRNFGVNQDITHRKKEELEKLALIDGLKTRNSNLQQFSYIVSHNLRSPIAKIQGLINIMDDNTVENEALIKMIGTEAANLDQVVSDINLIVSARKTDQEKWDHVSFANKVKQVTHVFDGEIEKKGITITTDFSQVESIISIKSYVYSIIYNLISNAIKYRSPARPLRIHIATRVQDELVCLSVTDNGSGIDMQKNGTKLFGLYKRFHGDAIPGKGVGLNLVRTHAESLGGRVEVESVVHEGSTFKVYLPLTYKTTHDS